MWRNTFWVAALGLIVAYLFFLVLGAFSIGDAVWLTTLVVLLAAGWVVQSVLDRRREESRDPRLVHARERRGF
jgi:uncharacterized membrane protein YdjX (TVP38/TMEM64 family)